MDKTKVSIIIPVYNVEPYVGECIESVMAQDAQILMECIVVDDRGSDNSMSVVNRLVEAYHGPIEFRIITREKNGGLSAARNSGIDVACGEYLYFLDSDDTITTDAIRLLWQQVQEHPGVDTVVGASKCFPTCRGGHILGLKHFKHPSYTCDALLVKRLFKEVPVVATNRFIRTDFLKSNCLWFKEGLIHEDDHLKLRMYSYIQSIAFVETITYNYRIRKDSIMDKSNAVKRSYYLMVIVKDLIEKGYVNNYTLNWMLDVLTDIRFETEYQEEFKKVRPLFVQTLKVVVENISFKNRLPFLYLRQPRPWMRAVILEKLARICF